jgi:hypothetical protein
MSHCTEMKGRELSLYNDEVWKSGGNTPCILNLVSKLRKNRVSFSESRITGKQSGNNVAGEMIKAVARITKT